MVASGEVHALLLRCAENMPPYFCPGAELVAGPGLTDLQLELQVGLR